MINSGRYLELFQINKIPCLLDDDILWIKYSGMVQICGPAIENTTIKPSKAKIILQKLKGILLRYSSTTKNATQWYAVVKLKHLSIEEYPSGVRSKIRRGIKRTKIEQIDPDCLEKKGFEILTATYKSYKGYRPRLPIKKRYQELCTIMKDFDDILNLWGIFLGAKLVGYAICYVYDDEELFLHTVIFSPEALANYGAYAFYHVLSSHYIGDRKVKYINEGCKNLLHNTNIYEFLEHNFMFEKQYLELHLNWQPSLRLLFRSSYVLSPLLSKLIPQYRALRLLESFSMTSQ